MERYRVQGGGGMSTTRQREARRSLLYSELRRALADELEGDPEALKLAEELVAAYERGGARALRERLRDLLREVVEGGAEAERAGG